jgi:glycosyltransferase involved in cell wall biosynthesis
LAHIALAAYDLETGGISRVTVYLANGFAARGHRVSLVLCSGAGELHGALAEELSTGVELVELSDRRFRSRAMGQVRTWRKMQNWLRLARPDVLLGTANNIAWWSGLVRNGLGEDAPRLFIKTTNPIMRTKDGAMLTAIRHAGYSRLFGAAEKVLALSEAEAQLLARQFSSQADRFVQVFNPYLTKRFLETPLRRREQGSAPAILALGRLAPQKNFARAIEAFAIAREKGGASMAGATLLIAGEGPLRPELEALVAKLGLRDVVSMPGFNSDAARLMADADLYLMSSEYEGLPAAVIEALGSGVPVVTTDCFLAARELLDGLPGCAVSMPDAQALANAMLRAVAECSHPEAMRERVRDYAIAAAVESHLAAMGLSLSSDPQ